MARNSKLRKSPEGNGTLIRPGERLEREVERLYVLLGASTRRRVLIKGYEVDVQALFRKGPFSFSVIVECKEHNISKAVSDLEMRSFVAKLLAAREAGVSDKGVFVTTSSYAKTALATAEQHGIQCLRLSDLYNQLVDFKTYLQDTVSDFNSTDLSRWYVEQTVSDVEDYDSLTAADRTESLHPGALDWVDHLFDEAHERRVALLGNFGTGKTSLCLKYRAVLAQRALASPSARIPVLIDLRDFRSGLDIHQVVSNTLQRIPGVEIDLRLCLELGRMGRFFFLLDGLDEMATRVDRSVVNESLREIDRLRTEGDNRYLVTCRTHFFQERILDEFLVDYRVLYLTEWGPVELREYLSRRFGPSGNERHARIVANPKLAELSRTPLLLEILLGADIPAEGHLNIYQLLSRYTDEWILRQSRRRGAVMTSEQRRRFAESLAMRMQAMDRSALHFSELYEVAREFSGFRDASRIDHFDADARTCTFITRDSQGNYGFRHKAFFEYFAASAISAATESGDRTSLELRELAPEIVDFIVNRGITETGLGHLDDWSKEFSTANLSLNAVKLLVGLRQPLDPAVQKRYKTSSADWNELERLAVGETRNEIDELLLRYGPRTREIARSLTARFAVGRGVDPEDLVSDALMILWNSARSGRLNVEKGVSVDNYLRAVMRNRLTDQLRANGLRSVVSVDDVDIVDEAQPSAERQVLHLDVIAAIERLPELDQEVVRLSYWEELSIAQIAERLQMSGQTVRHIRARAIRRLREYLQPQ